MIEKRKPYRNKRILQAANGAPCMAQFPGCTGGGEDPVFCHLNESWAGKGMGQKADDCAGFIGCSNCHDIYDKRKFIDMSEMLITYNIFRAYYRTIRYLLDKGVLK